ncbi:MAG: AAA family ATPase [Arcobacteraceae bacterium]|nr:AAA family ATPase [Arcobacteraceae bacterium]
MKIDNITIENYRFFKENQSFKFDNKNILLYGENGSGKTSLYNALKDFFFYYENESKSKRNLKDNKNIFSNTTDEPKINLTFSDDKIITFDKNGLNDDSLKQSIERVAKSKLFLTYQDVYNLNKMFQKELTYLELKNIALTLFYDELSNEFFEFEKSFKILEDEILNVYSSLIDSFEDLEKKVYEFKNNFLYELEETENIDEKKSTDFAIQTVYYLPELYKDKLFDSINRLDIFLKLSTKLRDKNTDKLFEKFGVIVNGILDYTLENDRYFEYEQKHRITIANKEEIQESEELDKFIEYFNDATSIVDEYTECLTKAEYINNKLFKLFDKLKDNVNATLNFLEVNIEIEQVREKPFINFDINYIFEEDIRNIDFKILLSGIELKEHWQKLNEAKLSALNIAIYLSSVLQKKPDIPILVLDDLLISLDMSNRDRILKLLLDRSGRYFDNEYQIMIFTHDKAFYELAKYKIEYQDIDNWNFFELFVDNEEVIEKPYLNEKANEGYHDKAIEYFEKREYAISSNFLRKEVEKQIHEYLGLRTLDGAIDTAKIKDNYRKLEECFPKLIGALSAFDNCQKITNPDIREEKCLLFAEVVTNAVKSIQNIINEDSFHDINGIKNRILNPQSHNDWETPLYKKELEDAIALINELDKIIEDN